MRKLQRPRVIDNEVSNGKAVANFQLRLFVRSFEQDDIRTSVRYFRNLSNDYTRTSEF